MVIILPVLYTVSSLFGNEGPEIPLYTEFPYLPDKGWPFFHIIYFGQIFLMWCGCNLAVGIELLSFFYIHYVCCRIEILSHMIDHWNVNIKCRQGDVSKNNILLEEIVQYHSSVKRNMDGIRRIFSPILMATLLTNSVVICMCLITIFVVNIY